MNKRTKVLLKNLSILTISNFASKILVFILVPLYTSVLSTDEYGTYDLIVSTVSLLVPILTLNIIDAVMRFLMDKDCNKTQVATIGIKFILISIFIVAIMLFIIKSFGLIPKLNGLYIYIFMYFCFYVFNQYCIQLAKGLDKVKEMGIAGVLGTLVMLLTNVIFLLVFKWGLIGFFLANILAQVIPVLYFAISLKIWNYIDFNNKNKRQAIEMLVYCMPLIASAVGWWINSGSDKYVVTFFCGIAANGILSVAYKIPSVLNTFQSIFMQAWQISAIKEYGEQDTALFYGNTFKVINAMMCIVCSVFIFMTKQLAKILYAKDFYIAWKFMPFLLVSSVLNCASGFLGPILSARKDSKSMAISAIFGAIINLILNVIFVFYMGAQGVTIATVIASFIIYEIRKIAVGKDIEISGYKTIFITWLLLIIQAIVEINNLLYVIEILIMLLVMILNSNDIKHIILSIENRLRKNN